MDNGVPTSGEYETRIADLEHQINAAHAIGFRDMRERAQPLVDRAKALVEALDRSETHEGGLLTVGMLKKKNELRLELARWAK